MESDSYTLQSSHNIVTNIIKSVELLCGAVYLNPLASLNQWYTPYENKSQGKTIVRKILSF